MGSSIDVRAMGTHLLQGLDGVWRVAVADRDNAVVQHDQLLHLVPELGRLAVRHRREDARRRVVGLDDHVPAARVQML